MRFLFSLKASIKPLLPHYISTRLLSSSRFNNSPTSMAIPPHPSAKSVAAVDSEVGLAKRSWIKFRRESMLALYTPFVLCLASGNLRVETFRHYIAQDVYFLRAFVQAYELAEECADDDDAKISISELRKAVLEELKMHNSFVQVK